MGRALVAAMEGAAGAEAAMVPAEAAMVPAEAAMVPAEAAMVLAEAAMVPAMAVAQSCSHRDIVPGWWRSPSCWSGCRS